MNEELNTNEDPSMNEEPNTNEEPATNEEWPITFKGTHSTTLIFGIYFLSVLGSVVLALIIFLTNKQFTLFLIVSIVVGLIVGRLLTRWNNLIKCWNDRLEYGRGNHLATFVYSEISVLECKTSSLADGELSLDVGDESLSIKMRDGRKVRLYNNQYHTWPVKELYEMLQTYAFPQIADRHRSEMEDGKEIVFHDISRVMAWVTLIVCAFLSVIFGIGLGAMIVMFIVELVKYRRSIERDMINAFFFCLIVFATCAGSTYHWFHRVRGGCSDLILTKTGIQQRELHLRWEDISSIESGDADYLYIHSPLLTAPLKISKEIENFPALKILLNDRVAR